jgi:hypothetical protein
MPICPKRHLHQAAQGSTVVLVLAVLLGITAQLLVLSLITTRSLGDEAALATQNQGVKEALNTALLRFKADVQAYANANNNEISVDFNQGGGSDYDDVTFALTDPETGTPAAGNVTVDAYVSASRGNYVQLTARATYNGIDLTKTQWFRLGTVEAAAPCDFPAPVQTITPLVTDIVDVSGTFYVDQLQSRAFFGDNNAATARSFMYKPCSGLTTLFNGTPHSLFQDVTNDNIFILDRGNQRFYWLKADNTLVSVPAMGGADFLYSNVVADPNTGMAYAYRQATGAEGLYGFNPNTETTTHLATFNWVKGDCTPLVYNMLNPADGRLYMTFQFHDGCFNATHHFLTYHSSTGLSTLLNGHNVGYQTLVVNPNTGRILFSNGSTSLNTVYTWHPTHGLATIGAFGWYGGMHANLFNILQNQVYTAPGERKIRVSFPTEASPSVTTLPELHYYSFSLMDLVQNRIYLYRYTDGAYINGATGTVTLLPASGLSLAHYNNAVATGCHPLTCSSKRAVHEANVTNVSLLDQSDVRMGNSSLPTVTGLYPGAYFGADQWIHQLFYFDGTTFNTIIPDKRDAGRDSNLHVNPTTGDLYIGSKFDNAAYLYLPSEGLVTLNGPAGSVSPKTQYNNMDFAHKGLFYAKSKDGLTTVYAYYHLDPNP